MEQTGERVRADAARNREAILLASAQVLSRHPSASLSEIAAGAGVGRATLYRHFASREALLDAMRDELLGRASLVVGSAAAGDGPPLEALRRVIHALVPLGLRFRGLVAGGADLDPTFRVARDEVLRPAYDLLARAVEQGDLRVGVSPEWASAVLSGLLVAAVRDAGQEQHTPEQLAELVYATLLGGLGPG